MQMRRGIDFYSSRALALKIILFFTPTHSFPLHITVVILTAWNNSAGLVDVFCKCLNLFLFMLSTAS